MNSTAFRRCLTGELQGKDANFPSSQVHLDSSAINPLQRPYQALNKHAGQYSRLGIQQSTPEIKMLIGPRPHAGHLVGDIYGFPRRHLHHAAVADNTCLRRTLLRGLSAKESEY